MSEGPLVAWFRWTGRRPRLLAVVYLALASVFALSIGRLGFDTDLDAMVRTPSAEVLQRIDRAFGVREEAFVVAELAGVGDSGALIGFARRLEAALEGEDSIAQVIYGFGAFRDAVLENLAPYGPRFATDGGEGLAQLLSDDDLTERVARQVARLSLPGLGDSERVLRRDPLDLGEYLWNRLDRLRGSYRFDRSLPQTISEDGRAILIRVRGTRTLADAAGVRETADAIDSGVAEARKEAPEGLEVRVGGGYHLARESEDIVRRDLIVTLSTSMVFVLALVAWTLRGTFAGFMVLPSLLLGLLSGIGIIALFRSRLPILALGSAAIQIGLGVDFAIHLMLRARAERAAGRTVEDSFAAATRAVGVGLVIAALTTAAAFMAFLLSDFGFLRDMGLLTSLGVLGTLAATLTFQAPLGRLWLSRVSGSLKPPRTLGVPLCVSAVTRFPGITAALALAVTSLAVLSLFLAPPKLGTDLRSIHARESAALEADSRVSEIFGGSREPLLLLLTASGEEEIEVRLRRVAAVLDGLVDDGVLAAHFSAAVLLPDPPAEGRVLEHFGNVDRGELRRRIDRAFEDGGFDASELSGAIDRAVGAALDSRALGLSRLRELGLGDWVDALVREDPDDPAGRVALVTLFPARDLWVPERRRAELAAIHEALSGIGVRARAVGLLTVSAESARRVVTELAAIGGLAFLAAAVLVALLFRAFWTTILVLTPVTLGCLWTAALYRQLGYDLHFMNAAVLPMIVGIGIDDGIHILHRFRSLRGPAASAGTNDRIREVFDVTGTAVALTSLTTAIAFGSLALSENRGLASIGVLALIGVMASLVASITVLPVLLSARSSRQRRKTRRNHG